MADNSTSSNKVLKIVLSCLLGAVILLMLINALAGYLLFKENKQKEALKRQLIQKDSTAKQTY